MDDISKPSRADANRETRRELLLRRLAQTLADMRGIGVVGPMAFEDLVARNPPGR
jgi:hypothetical protein